MDSGAAVALISGGFSVVAVVVSFWAAIRTRRLEHRYGALDRLRSATGRLRLELFLSARSVIRRVGTYSEFPHEIDTFPRRGRMGEYHDGGLMIYRLLRPLAISSLIEPQLYLRDLTLDRRSADLLEFGHAAYEMLTGQQIRHLACHEKFDMGACWGSRMTNQEGPTSEPFQRIRASYLRVAADALLVGDPGGQRRCMGHPEFIERWNKPAEYSIWHASLEPVKQTLDQFDRRDNAIFWLRIVGYAYVCKRFFDRQGRRSHNAKINYAAVDLDTVKMIESACDPCLNMHASKYPRHFKSIIADAI